MYIMFIFYQIATLHLVERYTHWRWWWMEKYELYLHINVIFVPFSWIKARGWWDTNEVLLYWDVTTEQLVYWHLLNWCVPLWPLYLSFTVCPKAWFYVILFLLKFSLSIQTFQQHWTLMIMLCYTYRIYLLMYLIITINECTIAPAMCTCI